MAKVTSFVFGRMSLWMSERYILTRKNWITDICKIQSSCQTLKRLAVPWLALGGWHMESPAALFTCQRGSSLRGADACWGSCHPSHIPHLHRTPKPHSGSHKCRGKDKSPHWLPHPLTLPAFVYWNTLPSWRCSCWKLFMVGKCLFLGRLTRPQRYFIDLSMMLITTSAKSVIQLQ